MLIVYCSMQMPRNTCTTSKKSSSSIGGTESLSSQGSKNWRQGHQVNILLRGERKRTAIGIELITNPSLVFLDEPTSGMDSLTAMKVIDIVSKLAKAGRTVITVIHQPNSDIYKMFDQLMLLSLGNTLYFVFH